MRNKIKKNFFLVRDFGFIWVVFRIFYELKRRTGIFNFKMPCRSWDEIHLKKYTIDGFYVHDSSKNFHRGHSELTNIQKLAFYVANNTFRSFDSEDSMTEAKANDIMSGYFVLFSCKKIKILYPICWHQNPFNIQIQIPLRHWGQISEVDFCDIKLIWELARFGFAYTLARAYVRTHDESYARSFWELLESWLENNPPNVGLHWKCGQEISVRVMACCFAFSVFQHSSETTVKRVNLFVKMMAVSAERIEANILYAVRQQNNHGVGEALGLWMIGILFPELSQAKRWSHKGLRILERLADDLIYSDGAYCQHSTNYTRVVLQYYIWMFVLARRVNIKINAKLNSQLHKAFLFLYQLHEPSNGRVPNYGPNDGAMVLPLNNCDYLDYRPILQAWHYYFYNERCFESGPWDEDLVWLFGADALSSKISSLPLTNLNADVGGYYTFRTPESWAFIRCVNFKHRPSHADQLHIDLWWRGLNIALDAGTYSYNAPPPWDRGFANAEFHNTVTVDGHDQMEKVGPFLWTPWSSGEVKQKKYTDNIDYWEGVHTGYCRMKYPTLHRRALIRLGKEHWLIFDYLESLVAHNYDLHFLLNDFPYQWDPQTGCLNLQVEEANYLVQIGANQPLIYSITYGDINSSLGWQSLYYNEKIPAISLNASAHAKKVVFWTVFGPDIEVAQLNGEEFFLKFKDNSIRVVVPCSPSSIVTSINICGEIVDCLEI